MSVESMLSDGLYLMMIGMGFVVCFLTILVLLLNLLEKVIPHEEVEAVSVPAIKPDNNSLTAVISAAIHEHRKNKP